MSVRDDPELTDEVVFERLERLRELLRLTDYLREFRPVERRESDQAAGESAPGEDRR